MSDFDPNGITMHGGMASPQNGDREDNCTCVEQLLMCSVSNGQQPKSVNFKLKRWLSALITTLIHLGRVHPVVHKCTIVFIVYAV